MSFISINTQNLWQNLRKIFSSENTYFLSKIGKKEDIEEFRIIDGQIFESKSNILEVNKVEEIQVEKNLNPDKKRTGRPLKIETIKKEFFDNIFGRLLPSTIRQYKLDLTVFELFLDQKNKRIHQLSVLDLEEYISWQRLRGCKEQIIRRRLSSLATLSKFLRKKGLNWIDVETIDRPKLRKKVARCIEPQTFENLLPKIKEGVKNKEKVATWIALMAICGLRIDEVAKAKMNGTKWLIKGKGEKERWVPCPTWLRMDLKPEERQSPDHIRRKVKAWLKEIKIEMNPHSLRHSYATYLLYKGVNLESVRKILGHEDIRTTQRYLHPEEVECLDFLE